MLKLLVNLSCCVDLIPHLLAAKVFDLKAYSHLVDENPRILFQAPPGLLTLLDGKQKTDVLLRAVTLALLWCSSVEALSLTYADIGPLNLDPFNSELQTGERN